MEIILAESAGFCFGVNNAIRILDKAIKEVDGKIYTLGEIIHNDQVVEYYKSKGVEVAENVEDIQEGASVVVRAHGISPNVMKQMKERHLRIFDATCPYVKKIQQLVRKKYLENYKIIIVGDREHPEVVGINGYCDNKAGIVNTEDDVYNLDLEADKICVVAQTTQKNNFFEKIHKIIEKKFKNAIKFDTICNATLNRQNEARKIASYVDAMIVVGGVHSSNTKKLYEISSEFCKKTFKIETAEEILLNELKNFKKIGITAGASTPEWVIKEVVFKMSELEKDELDFKTLFEQSFVTLNTGDIVKGKIISFNEAEVYVDLGYKSDGVIPKEQYDSDPDFKFADKVKIGDEIEVFVVNVNDRDGNVLLSKTKVDERNFKEKINEFYKEKTIIDAKIIDVVNGGVIALSNGVRIFIPGSQLSDRYVDNFQDYLRKNIKVRIIECDLNKGRIVASHRVVLEETKSKAKDEFWDEIEIGKRMKGRVKNIMDFGVFVDLGAIDGLVHISELCWEKIRHPLDVVKEGQEIEVEVLNFDKAKNKVSLTHKKCVADPWDSFIKNNQVGDVIDCKVVRFTNFGAFVEVDDGVDGLVHISEISDYKLGSPKEVLKQSQVVRAKILKIEEESRRISLSIKAVEPINPKDKGVQEKIEKAEEVSEHKEELKNTIADSIKE